LLSYRLTAAAKESLVWSRVKGLANFLLRLLANFFLWLAINILYASVLFTLSNYRDIYRDIDEEIPRPSGALAWLVDIAGVGFAGGLLGALVGTTLGLAVVQSLPVLIEAFPLDASDWVFSYILLIPLGWLVLGPLGSAGADATLLVIRVRRSRIYLMSGGFAFAALVSLYFTLWRRLSHFI
jgi:hypothetical protein